MNESQQIEYGADYVLVSDYGVAVPDDFVLVCHCPAGHYYARPGVTFQMIREAVQRYQAAAD